MQVLERRRRRWVLLFGMACLLPTASWAHPGSGIALDKNGQVYFLDTGSGLWKVDLQGKLTKVDGARYHWLALDEINALANTRLPSGAGLPTGGGWDITKVSTSPTVLMASDWPIAVDDKGTLYYQAGSPAGLQIMQTLPSGVSSVFATLPATTMGGSLPHLNGITAGPDGSVYYTEDFAIRRITSKGEVSTAARVPALVGGASVPGVGINSGPLLRALQVDAKGVMYVAAEGQARVLKITPEGNITTLLQSQSPWSPTGVALLGGDVYVLEFLHTARDVRSDWFPRVRKLAADGKETILATVDQMPGARASVPPAPKPVEELNAVVQDSGECHLDWKAAALGSSVDESLGAVSHYRVERRARKPGVGLIEEWGAWQVSTIDPQSTIKGLERGVDYEFRVTAINAGGASAPSRVVTAVVRWGDEGHGSFHAKLKKDPALRHINGAVRSIDKAAKATGDNAVRKALEEARATLAACLAMNGASPGKGVLKPRRAAAPRSTAGVDPGSVLTYVRNNPGSSGEQIAAEMATDTATLRPVLRELIEAGEVKASGKARGTRYAAG